MSNLDAREILAEVRENIRRLKSCPRHTVDPASRVFGQPTYCIHCGGKLRAEELMQYIAGYRAAGGNANDIWPGYDQDTYVEK